MKRRLHITLSYSLFDWLKEKAYANGLSISGFINYKLMQMQEEEKDATMGTKDSRLTALPK